MSGHRRAARPTRRRGRLVAAGFAAVLVFAACGAVARASGVGRDHAQPVRSRTAAAENSPMNTLQGSERDVVPSACDTLSPSVAGKLAPGADRNATIANQSDQHSECAWGLYGAARSRQLGVELRAIPAGGMSATAVATRTFTDEWRSDRAGNDLADGAKVRDSRGVTGVGEQAYTVYTVDGTDGIGSAVANVRLANILITVRYSGGDDREAGGVPLSSRTTTDGALMAARDIVSKLESHS